MVLREMTFLFSFFLLKSFWPGHNIAGLWDVGLGGDSGPGINGRRPGESIPFRPGPTPSALGLVPNPAGERRSPTSGGSAFYPADDVHRTWNT